MSEPGTILIVGGGASGMMAALTALQNPASTVLLAERQARLGRKLLSTGNGRCNLTNRGASPGRYHGQHPEFCRFALESFSVENTLDFFAALGLETVTEPDGKVYPRSNMANSVLDVLRFGLEGYGGRLRLLTGDPVKTLRRMGGYFSAALESGLRLTEITHVILAAGGAAGSKVGGVPDGYRLAKALGHHRTALYPALVQLKTEPTYPRALKGVKTPAHVCLYRGHEMLAENNGEILFTEYGVSGPAIFEISRCTAGEEGITLSLDLWAEKTEEEITGWLLRRCRAAAAGEELTCGKVFTGVLHSRLGQMVVKYAGVSTHSGLFCDLTESDARRLARACKHFTLPVTGTCGFDQAQVTAGGLDTAEFDPRTLESRLVPGLYACGEVLDIDGDCGGFNLQWAWSSGHLAGLLSGKA